jgi:hypothetical protein
MNGAGLSRERDAYALQTALEASGSSTRGNTTAEQLRRLLSGGFRSRRLDELVDAAGILATNEVWNCECRPFQIDDCPADVRVARVPKGNTM